MTLPDGRIRERIIRETGATFTVEAGAGTGKTTLLTDRVLAHLESGMLLSRIAVITFTRKAAAELSARVREKLGARREENWAAAALDEFDRACIGTTDSFCRTLLSDFALEAGVPPGFAVADDTAQQALKEEAIRIALSPGHLPDAEGLRMLADAGVRPASLRKMAKDFMSGRPLPPAPEPVSSEDLVAVHRRHLDAIDALIPRCTNPEDRLLGYVRTLQHELEAAEALGAAAGARILSRTSADPRPGGKGRAGDWEDGAKAEVLELFHAFQEDREESLRARACELTGIAATWFDACRTAYQSLKRERGLLDFGDLTRITRSVLDQRADVRRRVAARYDAILMDEVQDTDPMQMEIAFLLTCSEPVPDDLFTATPQPGRLFLVGDPKQSIYRFRHADIELYEKARARVAECGEGASIFTNFRSHPAILNFVNDLFAGWMSADDGTHQARYEPLAANPLRKVDGEGADDEPRIHLLLTDPAGEASIPEARGKHGLKAPARREMEVDSAVRLIRQMLAPSDAGPWRVNDPSTGKLRNARPDDIAILMRNTKLADDMLDGLRRSGLPATVAGGRRFFRREEIATLLAVLEHLVQPEDRFLRFAALRSLALAFPDGALAAHFLALDDAPGSAEVRDAEAFLADLAREARARPLADLLTLVCERLSLFAIFAFRSDGPARVEGLRMLLNHASSLEEAEVDSLPAFVAWLRDRTGLDSAEAPGDPDPGSAGGVQILTMHKAKGLEFPIVILADLGSENSRTATMVLDRETGRTEFSLGARIATPGYEEAAAAEKVRQSAEEVRLLYVAMTRARDHLVISWPEGATGSLSGSSLGGKLGPPPGEAAPEESGLHTIPAATLPPRQEGTLRRTLSVDDAEETAAALSPRPPGPTGWAGAIHAASRPAVALTPSGLAHDEPAPPSAPCATPPTGDGRAIGTLVHKALELLVAGGVDAAQAFEQAVPVVLESIQREREEAFHFDDRSLATARSLVDRAAASTVLATMRSEGNCHTEVPFVLGLEHGTLSGDIDVLRSNPDGTLSVFDYKTDRVTADEIPARAEHYRKQLLAYATAAATITDRVVRDATLLFLSVDPVEAVAIGVEADSLDETRRMLAVPGA
ncbi:MAG: UvrD-helicase domain-containing protein [Gemmatimonadota bacterium]|nr:UvrD-helicase domain-containing protein [Gemmatimonadota bacterium]MDP6803099.1 UvrD-helicase domain-containing protein [Gemmatimonadota bacterium]